MEGGAPPPRARTGSVFVDENDDVRPIIAQLRAAVSAGEVISASTLDSLVEALEGMKSNYDELRGDVDGSLTAKMEGRKAAKMSALVNTQELAELAERVAGVRVIALEVLDGLQKAETACACEDKRCDECGGTPFPTDTWLQAVQLCERIKSVFTEQGLLDCEGGVDKEERVRFAPAVGGGGGGGPDLRWRYVMPKGEGEKVKLRTAKGVAPDVLLDVAGFEDLSIGPFNMCIAAGTNSGKSYLMAGIALKLVEEERVHDMFILSADPDTVKEPDSPFLPVRKMVVDMKGVEKVYRWAEETLVGIVRWQEGRRNDGTMLPILIILDDVDDVEKSPTLLALFKRGRHIKVYLSILSQTANRTLAPTFKTNSRFILFGALPPAVCRDLVQSITLTPAQKPKAVSNWISAEIGGAEGTEQAFVFGLYDSHKKILLKMRR